MASKSRRQAITGLMAGAGAAFMGLAAWRFAYAQSVREIQIVAQRFKFSPNIIALKVDEPVLLLISSLDYIHGFHVPDLGLRSDLLPGLVTKIHMTPKLPGRLDFLCDNFCGDNHEEMHGHFNVEV